MHRTYIAWHDAGVESSRECTVATGKHVLPPQVHMNVLHAQPTPPHPCIHAPTGSHRQACPSSASSHERYYMPHPTTPHPTPPMCTKHHGLLKAVVQLWTSVRSASLMRAMRKMSPCIHRGRSAKRLSCAAHRNRIMEKKRTKIPDQLKRMSNPGAGNCLFHCLAQAESTPGKSRVRRQVRAFLVAHMTTKIQEI